MKTDQTYRTAMLIKTYQLICDQGNELTVGDEVISLQRFVAVLERYFDRYFPETVYSPREIQKRLGSDLCRQHLHRDIWVACLRQQIEQSPADTLSVITDLRFPNEVDLVRSLGGKLVYLTSERAWKYAQQSGLLNHESEAHYESIRDASDLVYANDGSLLELRTFALELYQRWFASASILVRS